MEKKITYASILRLKEHMKHSPFFSSSLLALSLLSMLAGQSFASTIIKATTKITDEEDIGCHIFHGPILLISRHTDSFLSFEDDKQVSIQMGTTLTRNILWVQLQLRRHSFQYHPSSNPPTLYAKFPLDYSSVFLIEVLLQSINLKMNDFREYLVLWSTLTILWGHQHCLILELSLYFKRRW